MSVRDERIDELISEIEGVPSQEDIRGAIELLLAIASFTAGTQFSGMMQGPIDRALDVLSRAGLFPSVSEQGEDKSVEAFAYRMDEAFSLFCDEHQHVLLQQMMIFTAQYQSFFEKIMSPDHECDVGHDI